MWLFRRLAYLLLILLVLYVVAWFSAAWIVGSRWQEFAARAETRGIEFTSDDVQVSGFPLAFRVTAENARVVRPSKQFEWIAPQEITIGIEVMRPFTSQLEFSGVHRFIQSGQQIVANVDSDLFEVNINPGTRSLGTVDIDVPAVDIRTANAGSLMIKGLRTSLGEPVDRRAPFVLAIDGIDLPSPVSNLAAPRDIVIQGDVFPFLPNGVNEEAIAKWQRESGLITISSLSGSSLDLGWSGEGQLSISPSLQPNVTLTTRIKGVDPFLQRLVTQGMVTEDRVGLVKFALALLTRPAQDGQGTEVVAPLFIQNGIVKLGPLDILELPQVEWPK